MKINRVQTRQAHYVPKHAYRPQPGNMLRDTVSTDAGSVGSIPGHLMPESMFRSQEIIVPELEEEMTGTAQNNFKPVKMLRCIDCDAVVPDTKTEDHICG